MVGRAAQAFADGTDSVRNSRVDAQFVANFRKVDTMQYRTMQYHWLAACMCLVFSSVTGNKEVCWAGDAAARIVVLVGPSNHPPGTHEVEAGARVIKYCLENAENVKGIRVDIISQWPQDANSLNDVASIVFSGDRFPPAEMPEGERIMADLTKMMTRGCGLMCYHYATGLNAQQVPPDGNHPLLTWMGGYFATRCAHHQSIARVYPSATIVPTDRVHPVLNGWQAFTIHDEPYIRNYFGKTGLAAGVTPLATSMLPPEAPHEEIVAWAVARTDGGRGVGVVMPHFFRNWQNADLRKLILNGIVWTARQEVPAGGVSVKLPSLENFKPFSVEPVPRAKN